MPPPKKKKEKKVGFCSTHVVLQDIVCILFIILTLIITGPFIIARNKSSIERIVNYAPLPPKKEKNWLMQYSCSTARSCLYLNPNPNPNHNRTISNCQIDYFLFMRSQLYCSGHLYTIKISQANGQLLR